MSTDKKPCSSCSTKLDLVLPGDGSVKVVIKIFIKNSQVVKHRIEQLFNSKNNDYKMTSYLKTKPMHSLPCQFASINKMYWPIISLQEA